MSQIVECGYNIKTIDLEKLQSLTLSGEKITKELFEALFVHQTPLYFPPPSSQVPHQPYNDSMYSSPTSSYSGGECGIINNGATGINTSGNNFVNNDQQHFNVKNYELFRGTFEAAATSGRNMAATVNDIGSEYQFYDHRFYQGHTAAAALNYY